MDTKTRPIHMLSSRDPLHFLVTHRNGKCEDGRKYSMQMAIKNAGVMILISDKIGLKIKNMIRDKDGHYIMIKGPIQDHFNI